MADRTRMVQLIYASAATRPFSAPQLNTLLEKARARNSLFSVTGMLLYHSGSFLILASIRRDPRHTNTKILSRQSSTRREFDQWAMGFVDTSQLERTPGLVDYHRTLPKLTIGSSDAKRYLRFFQDGLCRQTVSV